MNLVSKKPLPSFGIGMLDQEPVCAYTVLSINEPAGDCAAYEGIGPCLPESQRALEPSLVERIRRGGMKITESKARDLFPEIETMNLRWRA